MKKIVNLIYKIVLIIILIGLLTTLIDYMQLKNNDFPLFSLRSYEAKTKKETFRGLFYKATRKVSISNAETIALSSDLKFTFLLFNLPLKRNELPIDKDFTIETKEEKKCTSSKLYFYNDNIKVYTYCLDDITINENNEKKSLKKALTKDVSIINKIENYLFISKKNSLMTKYVDIEETNLTNKGFSLIKCESKDNNDIYVGPKAMEFQEDFCTLKDDIPKKETPSNNEENILENNTTE